MSRMRIHELFLGSSSLIKSGGQFVGGVIRTLMKRMFFHGMHAYVHVIAVMCMYMYLFACPVCAVVLFTCSFQTQKTVAECALVRTLASCA